nr:hypothetical protein [Desulfobacterales bacterium]
MRENRLLMKKVLMIAYYYPPLGGVGTLRTIKFAKYLPKFGWHPIILTPETGVCSITCDKGEGDIDGVEIVRTGYFDIFSFLRRFQKGEASVARENFGALESKGLKRKLSAFLQKSLNEWVAFPDSRIGWYPYAMRRGIERIGRGDMSIIFSTSAPETAHLIAYSLKQRTGIPWVADLRDLWTQHHGYQRTRLRLRLEKVLEKKVLSNANALITVSDPWARRLRSTVSKVFNGNVFTITNGFDPDDFSQRTSRSNGKFIITYVGTLYLPNQDLTLLFKVLNQLCEKGHVDVRKVEIRFYGSKVEAVNHLWKKSLVGKSVKIFDNVSHEECAAVQKDSTALLLLDWQQPEEKGVLPAKLFEYLGARRPILCISTHKTVVTDLLKRTNAGVVVKNEEEMRAVLLRWYREFIETGEVKYHGIESEIMKHTRENKTRQLVEVFEKVCSHAACPGRE